MSIDTIKYPSLGKVDAEDDDYVEFGDGREARVLEFLQNHPFVSDLRGNPSKVLAAMDEFSAQEDFLISVGSDKERLLTGILAAEAPKVLVELGGYLGYSAILFADAMKRANPQGSPPPVVWSFEFSQEFADVAAKIIELAGLSESIKIVVGPADESIRRLKEEGKLATAGVDVLFLDHVEDLYVQDLKVCEELGLLKPGALILADNVVRPGAPEYVKYVRAHQNLESHGVRALIVPGEFEDEIEVTRVKK
ncbi:S-adenosyl-L-methionine-dependent methyltransferase [Cryphonectria parasitica EP155]|uniref:catechol O-methyltransferase n=1 Tax=Cryphonectria parasitica (strain ATCC 38755 / EP155) TaxID=660469 RepID=A0A9P5CK31_CRYP1|nr:S-adenosyl-L-methionine-dependent methyltransferase [Cryphonectria parasitica EP155]KAF3761854.1 S-adenosyl-L-methionine-dependent methyltransferase [Cryphonectria parasitica EP155]